MVTPPIRIGLRILGATGLATAAAAFVFGTHLDLRIDDGHADRIAWTLELTMLTFLTTAVLVLIATAPRRDVRCAFATVLGAILGGGGALALALAIKPFAIAWFGLAAFAFALSTVAGALAGQAAIACNRPIARAKVPTRVRSSVG